MLHQQESLLPNEENLLYEIEFLLTNVPIQETIHYIKYAIYIKISRKNMVEIKIQTPSIKIIYNK